MIKDSGIGITPENLSILFMDFGKLTDNEGRNKCGTGLGLSICKQIIEQMGGAVSVKSKVNIGTEFIIDMKVKGKYEGVELNKDLEPIEIKLLGEVEKEGESRSYLKFLEA